jgi:hypothetical protein
MGFQGGGGREVVKRATLLEWLADPSELAAEVERYARRRAENADDRTAKVLEGQLLALARRILSRAGSQQSSGAE